VLYFHTIFQLYRYPRYPRFAQEIIRRRRMKKLIVYAAKHSPFYARLYEGIDLTRVKSPSQLPMVTKAMMVEHADDFVTDRQIKAADIAEFMRHPENKSQKFLGKYLVTHTSGTTLTPATVLYDKKAFQVIEVSSVMRQNQPPLPHVTLTSDNGFYLSNCSAMQGGGEGKYFFLNSSRSNQEVVDDLNRIQPATLQTYAGVLSMLAYEQMAGNLHIRPQRLIASGELLTPATRSLAEKAFGCKVYSMYAATEPGFVGMDCDCGHIHIYDDWLEIEPLDRNNRPVRDGEFSDHICITNFANRIQPLIRYEMNDHIRIHREGCPCGCKRPWVEIEGRANDSLLFEKDGRKAVIAYFSFEELYVAHFEELFVQFQVLLHDPRHLEVRIHPLPGVEAAPLFPRVEAVTCQMLAENGIKDVEVAVNDQPLRVEKSGKTKFCIQLEQNKEIAS